MDKQRILDALDAVKTMRESVTDEQAAACPEVFPMWEPGKEYDTGERILYNGKLRKVLQDHTSQAGWTPDAAPSLFAEVLPGQGGTEVGEWTQPDSTNAYNTGDRCMFQGVMYESVIDNNVWSPAAYPAGWKAIT